MQEKSTPPLVEEQTKPSVDNNVGEAEDKNFGKLFLCDPSWYETLEDEEDSVRLHVYDALFKYRLTGEVPELSAVEKAYFKFMTHAVDRFDKGKKEHDKETSRVRSINGKKGAEARWGKEKMANDGKNGKNGHTIPSHTIPSPSSMCIVNNTSSNADASEASSAASIEDYYNSQVSLRGARLRQSKGLTKKRRQSIGARLKEYGVEKVKECVTSLAPSHSSATTHTLHASPHVPPHVWTSPSPHSHSLSPHILNLRHKSHKRHPQHHKRRLQHNSASCPYSLGREKKIASP